MMKRIFVYVIYLVLFPLVAVAQNCQEEIDKVNKLYDDGIYREAEVIAKQILDSCELNKTQRNEMLKLMASIYYEMDELELAQEYVAKFVKKNPNYVTGNEKDTRHFELAFDKVKSWPGFSVGLRFGSSLGFPGALKIYPNIKRADYTKSYVSKLGLAGAFDFSWNISNFVALNASPGYRSLVFQHEVPMYDNSLTFNYEEESSSLTFPVMIMGTIPINDKLYISLGAGGELSYFLSGSYNYYYDGDRSSTTEVSYFLDLTNENGIIESAERNQLRYGAIGAFRFSYQREKLTFFADLRYTKEFSQYTTEDNKYYNPDLYLLNNYTLADLQISNMDFSLGVLYNFAYRVKSKY